MTTAVTHLPKITSPDGDFHRWALDTAAAIRARRFEGVDWDAVAEEIEDMGRGERRALECRLEVLLTHLLEWRFQPEQLPSAWTGTIKEQRRKAERLLPQNLNLRPLLPELIADAYSSALAAAERDTGIEESRFPPSCPWSVAEIMDEGFWPEPRPEASGTSNG